MNKIPTNLVRSEVVTANAGRKKMTNKGYVFSNDEYAVNFAEIAYIKVENHKINIIFKGNSTLLILHTNELSNILQKYRDWSMVKEEK